MREQIKYISNSIQGHQRKLNQDGRLVIESDDYNLYIIFDGLSSHPYSYKFIEAFKEFYLNKHKHYLNSKGDNLNKLLFDGHIETLKLNIDGLTTIAGIFISDDLNTAKYFSLGDSRIYSLKENILHQITIDDNISKYDHLVTRCLGLKSLTIEDCEIFEAEKNSDFLLCTDGFYPLMEENQEFYVQLLKNENMEEIKSQIHKNQKDINIDDSTYILLKRNKE